MPILLESKLHCCTTADDDEDEDLDQVDAAAQALADPDAKMIVDTYDPIIVSVHQDSYIRFWDMEVSDRK